MELAVGLRVVRGPDWCWGDQDGGEGGLGTVVEVKGESVVGELAVVVWDVGYKSSYKCGAEGKYELLVYDNGPSGITQPNSVCGACQQHSIMGMKWTCTVCRGIDLCTPCYYCGEHNLKHSFCRILSSKEKEEGGTTLPPRQSSKSIPARGLFPGASVVPGEHWSWKNQANGTSGVVTKVKGYGSESARSVIEVEWKTSQKNIYRVGHKGKVDLKCIKPGQGGPFYPDHLPKLGASRKGGPQISSAVAPDSATPSAGTKTTVSAVVAKAPPGSIATVSRTTSASSVASMSTVSPTISSLTVGRGSECVATPVGSTSSAQGGASIAQIRESVIQSGVSVSPDGASFSPSDVPFDPAATSKDAAPSSASPPPVTTPLATPTSSNLSNESTTVKAASSPQAVPDNSLLPTIAAPNNENATLTGTVTPALSSPFETGDRVKVMLELEIFKMMQEGHGGWNEQMNEVLTEVGTIHSVLDSGDLRVRYSKCVWTMNSEAVVKVEVKDEQLSVGDVVRVLDDLAKVHSLQENHGGWMDDMALSLGQVGRVTMVFPSGDIRVGVNGMMWTFNPACLVPAPGEDAPELPAGAEGLTGDLEQLQMKLLSLLGDSSAVMVAAAASGDESTVRRHLSKNPQDVNIKAGGKSSLHCAIAGGHSALVKMILDFSPDLEMGDEDGDTPLHVCAWTDEDESAKLLIDRGVAVNSTNNNGATPLVIAAAKGHHSVLRILANNPQVNLHEQDSNGDTALHCAVMGQKNESVSILLDAGADPTLLNFRLSTPIHEAARVGFLPAIEHFARKKPDYVNLKKDDGYTAIHLASLNDHFDVVTALVDMEFCNMNETTETGQTALHLAAHQGYARIVERLVGYGIELNTQDGDGDTALHLVLMRDTPVELSDETPQLRKVQESLALSEDTSQHGNATVACFLIQEGASTLIANNQGATPLEVCSPEVATMVMTFSASLSPRTSGKFHGSMRALPGPPTAIAASPTTTVVHDKPYTSDSTDGPTSPSASATATVSSTVEECFLCEAPVEVRFEPCGHAILCSECAERAKKCVKCKAAVKKIIQLRVTCPMCSEEEATVTMRPCGHQFCPACAKRMKRCFDCREEITDKEGLTKDTPSVNPGGPENPNCAICLTEPKNTVLLCGHQLCWDCAQKVDHCPVCRKFVTHRIRMFQ